MDKRIEKLIENISGLSKAAALQQEKLLELKKQESAINEKMFSKIDGKKAGINDDMQQLSAINEKQKVNNMLLKAIHAEILRDAESIICLTFLENREKVENTPARYKKVLKYFDILKGTGCRAYYSEYYHYIEIDFLPASYDCKVNLYITSGYNEPVIDFTTCEKNSAYIYRTFCDVLEDVENFIQAQKELKDAAAAYEKQVKEIKSGRSCLGLSFSDKY